MQGAALSYYTVFALVPMIILILGVVGLFFEEAFIRDQLEEGMREMLGNKATTQIFQATISRENDTGNILSTVIGFGILIFSSTAVLFSLKIYINSIWRIPEVQRKFALKNLIDRGISFIFLLGFGMLIITSFFVEAGIAALNETIVSAIDGLEKSDLRWMHWVTSVGFNTILFFTVFKLLPDARVHAKVALLGAFVTALLFQLSQVLIGFYLHHSPVIQMWGAAGSLVVVLLWVFMTSQVILYGVKMTYLFAAFFGHSIQPLFRFRSWNRDSKEDGENR